MLEESQAAKIAHESYQLGVVQTLRQLLFLIERRGIDLEPAIFISKLQDIIRKKLEDIGE